MTARIAKVALSIDGGEDLASKVNPRLLSLRLSELREAEADTLEIRLLNRDGRIAVPRTGAVLNLSLGWKSGDDVAVGLVDKGSFTVDEVGQEGPPDAVVIKARSADLTGLLRQRRTKTWRDTDLSAILTEIAGRHGREAKVALDFEGRAIDAIEQEGKSDAAFVADLGRRYDAVATWKGGFLLFLPIGASSTATGAPLARATLTKRDGWAWTFRQRDREAYDGAEAQWQDQDAGQRKTITIGGDSRRKLKRIYATEGEARQAAQSAVKRAERTPHTFTYELAVADPALQPDARVSLSGWGEKIDGFEWLVERVDTEFGAGGLQQKVELEGLA